MTIAGEGYGPAYNHFAKLAEQYDISIKDMAAMIAEITDVTERWPEFAGAAGVSKIRMNHIAEHLLLLPTELNHLKTQTLSCPAHDLVCCRNYLHRNIAGYG